jgi:hypothetical protein
LCGHRARKAQRGGASGVERRFDIDMSHEHNGCEVSASELGAGSMTRPNRKYEYMNSFDLSSENLGQRETHTHAVSRRSVNAHAALPPAGNCAHMIPVVLVHTVPVISRAPISPWHPSRDSSGGSRCDCASLHVVLLCSRNADSHSTLPSLSLTPTPTPTSTPRHDTLRHATPHAGEPPKREGTPGLWESEFESSIDVRSTVRRESEGRDSEGPTFRKVRRSDGPRI